MIRGASEPHRMESQDGHGCCGAYVTAAGPVRSRRPAGRVVTVFADHSTQVSGA